MDLINKCNLEVDFHNILLVECVDFFPKKEEKHHIQFLAYSRTLSHFIQYQEIYFHVH